MAGACRRTPSVWRPGSPNARRWRCAGACSWTRTRRRWPPPRRWAPTASNSIPSPMPPRGASHSRPPCWRVTATQPRLRWTGAWGGWGGEGVNLYTGPYAAGWGQPQQAAVLARYRDAAQAALDVGLGVNAGHDLNRDNLATFVREVPGL